MRFILMSLVTTFVFLLCSTVFSLSVVDKNGEYYLSEYRGYSDKYLSSHLYEYIFKKHGEKLDVLLKEHLNLVGFSKKDVLIISKNKLFDNIFQIGMSIDFKNYHFRHFYEIVKIKNEIGKISVEDAIDYLHAGNRLYGYKVNPEIEDIINYANKGLSPYDIEMLHNAVQVMQTYQLNSGYNKQNGSDHKYKLREGHFVFLTLKSMEKFISFFSDNNEYKNFDIFVNKFIDSLNKDKNSIILCSVLIGKNSFPKNDVVVIKEINYKRKIGLKIIDKNGDVYYVFEEAIEI